MSKNDIWVKEILWNITDEIINKYEKLNFPFRTVMIKSNFCYCCKKLKNNIRYLAEDSYRGRFKFLGWLYCDDCELLVNLAHENIFLYKNFIRYSKCKFLTKQKFYATLSGKDKRLLKAIYSPIWVFVKIFIIKLGFLEGWRGFVIAYVYARYTFWKYY